MSDPLDTHIDDDFCRETGEIVIPPIAIPKHEWWSQNDRGDWHAKARRMADVKKRATWLLRQWARTHPTQCKRITSGPVRVVAVIHPIDRRRYDPGNAADMVKAIVDAATICGLWADDDSTHVRGPDYRAGTPTRRRGEHAIGLHIIPIHA